jgi:hypothetical protein
MKKNLIIIIALFFIPAFSTLVKAASMEWTKSSGVVEGYRVYIGSLDTAHEEVGPDVFSYPLGDLVVGQQYTVGVSAFNSAGESSINAITFNYDPGEPPPGKPNMVQVNFSK